MEERQRRANVAERGRCGPRKKIPLTVVRSSSVCGRNCRPVIHRVCQLPACLFCSLAFALKSFCLVDKQKVMVRGQAERGDWLWGEVQIPCPGPLPRQSSEKSQSGTPCLGCAVPVLPVTCLRSSLETVCAPAPLLRVPIGGCCL